MEIIPEILGNGDILLKFEHQMNSNEFKRLINEVESNFLSVYNDLMEEFRCSYNYYILSENQQFDICSAPVLTDIFEYDNNIDESELWESNSWIYPYYQMNNWFITLIKKNEIHFVARKNF
jgi:hypothetical protein